MARKKTRHHSRWRIDHDYWQKLTPEQRDWLAKFDDEFYRATFEGKPLHRTKALRREIYRAQNAAERDIVTTGPTEIAAVLSKGAVVPQHRDNHIELGDYAIFRDAGAEAVEDGLVAAYDAGGLELLAELAKAIPVSPCRIKRLKTAS